MKPEKLTEIKRLKTLFFDCEQFVLTGSTVVEMQGLCSSSADIDIILIEPSTATKNLLRQLVTDLPAKSNSVKIMEEKGFHSFTDNCFKVDVFIQPKTDGLYDSRLTYDGITLSPIINLVQAKKSHNRLKDILQLRAWAEKLHDPARLIENLISVQTENDYNN